MAKTLLDLFNGNPDIGNKDKPKNPTNFAEAELAPGLRFQSLVDINNHFYTVQIQNVSLHVLQTRLN